MVSNRKHFGYNSDTTTDEDTADMNYSPNNQVHTSNDDLSDPQTKYKRDFQPKKPRRKPTRTPKCFTKNALMARENRLKKKVYIANLEGQVSSLKTENKKLSAIVENQSFMMDELRREVKYLKSVISNSKDIGKLIQAINLSTGMTVTSSLEEKPFVNTRIDSTSPMRTHMVPEAKDRLNPHPWEENDNIYINYPTPESSKSYYSNPEFDELNNDGLLLDLDIPLQMDSEELLGFIDEKALENPLIQDEDHNYHSPVKSEVDTTNNYEDDVGVCLHVSKNKVSLEFCPSCSDNALQSPKLT